MNNRYLNRGPFLLLSITLLVFSGCRTKEEAHKISPANPDASEITVKVLNYLYDLQFRPDKKLISGHLAGGAVSREIDIAVCENYYFKWDEIDYIKEVSGQIPGVMCVDLAPGFFYSDNPLETQVYLKDCLEGMKKQWNEGGLLMATTHCMNPANLYKTGGGVRDSIDIKNIYTPGNEYYDNYRVIMDKWAGLFEDLAYEDMVVIWRPYNEIGHANKWWCRQPPEEFIELWKYTFNYFTEEKQLNNLLWQWDSHKNHGKDLEFKYYPGDEFVDIVGASVYTNEGGTGPSMRENPYPQKVFSIAEIGPKAVISGKDGWEIIQRDYDWNKILGWMQEYHPYAAFFVTWDRTWGPYGRGTNLEAVYNNSWLINRDQLKTDFPR